MTDQNVIESASTMPDLLGSDFSIELSPEMVQKFAPDPKSLPLGSKVFLTHITGKNPQTQIDAANRLLSMGYVPVVHLGARNFESEEDFVRLVKAHSENGVTHGLFLGGNPIKHRGPLHEALNLLTHDVLPDTGITHAFIGDYPEGHPDIGTPLLTKARNQKLEACYGIGLKPEIVTQFAFNGEVMATWANKISQENPGVPIRLGLAGVTSLPKLIKFAVMCGVGPSIAVLKKNAGGLMKVMNDRDPGDVVEEIEHRYFGDAPVNVHFFPFGGWKKTLDWISVQRGDF